MTVELLPHQQEDLDFLRSVEGGALYHEPGVGKTYPAALRIIEAVEDSDDGVALVFTEASILSQIKKEIEACLPEGADIKVATVSGKTNKGELALLMRRTPDILVVNYEYARQVSEWLPRGRVVAVWCDEGHRIKGFRGMRSRKHGLRAKVIIDLAEGPNVKVRVLTTATPNHKPNSSEIFGLYYFLDKRIFGPTLWRFESQYYYNISRSHQYKSLVVRPDMKKELSRRMFSCARRLLKTDIDAPFPDREARLYEAEMPPGLARAYHEMEMETVVELQGEVVTRPLLLARLMSLQQMATGFLIERESLDPLGMERTDKRKVIHIDSSHKDEILRDILAKIEGESVIVWAVFTHEIEHLMILLKDIRGHTPSRVDGKCSGKERDMNLEMFKSGRSKTLVAHPAAAGAGLNLQIAGHAVGYSRTYKCIEYEQRRGRNHRLGKMMHETIFDHEIVTVGTKDEDIHKALMGDIDLASEITLDFLGPARNKR